MQACDFSELAVSQFMIHLHVKGHSVYRKKMTLKTTENQHSYQQVCPQRAKYFKQYDPNSHRGKQDRLRLASVEEGTHIHDPRS